MTDTDPLTVACPRCGAQPRSDELPAGEHCRTASGRPDSQSHKARHEAAAEAHRTATRPDEETPVPDDRARTTDAAASGLTPPTTDTAPTADEDPQQDQQDRLPTDPAFRRAALRAQRRRDTPDEDTGQHAERVELDIDRLAPDQLDRLATLVSEHLAAQAEHFTAELISPSTPGRMLGATVWFRSRTGRWTAPATVTATLDSLYQPNVDAGHVPPLSDGAAVHLTVLTPGIQGHVSAETAEEQPELVADDRPNKPAGGTFQEWDVQWWDPGEEAELDPATFAFEQQPAGTWMWPL